MLVFRFYLVFYLCFLVSRFWCYRLYIDVLGRGMCLVYVGKLEKGEREKEEGIIR